jgi:ElaB/YqjD/DUF883 family membrane-anchored ribosome-binding protein
MKNQTRDTIKDAVDELGEAVGDAATQFQGSVRQVAGKAQENVKEAMAAMSDTLGSSPLATAAIAAGVGFILGMIWSRRS